MKKIRKRRHGKSYDLCPYCGNANCDPCHSMGNKGIAMKKIQKRLKEGKCMGCGQEKDKCKCKSSIFSR